MVEFRKNSPRVLPKFVWIQSSQEWKRAECGVLRQYNETIVTIYA